MSIPVPADTIRTEPKPVCPICASRGHALYRDLRDRLFGVSGTWSLRKCTNDDCGLVWLDPAPHGDDLWKLYLNYYTHTDTIAANPGPLRRLFRYLCDCYLSLRYGYFPGTAVEATRLLGVLLYLMPGKRADLDFSVMYLPARRGGRLLEVGCGSGAMLKDMERLGWVCEGTDFDRSGVENARRKGLDVRHGSLEEQGYADDTFDAVMLSHVIEHVPDPQALLRECHRILKPGGMLSLVTPNSSALAHALFGECWLHLDPPRHLHLHNTGTITTLARRTGFRMVSAATTVRDAHSLYWASYSLRRSDGFSMGSHPPTLLKIAFRLLRLVEYHALRFLPQRGEELAVIGIK